MKEKNSPTFTTGEGAVGLVIGERYFIPNYGYTICEYVRHDGVNQLIVPDNLLS
jgi:F0F1-type ATP synthase alpha subunit